MIKTGGISTSQANKSSKERLETSLETLYVWSYRHQILSIPTYMSQILALRGNCQQKVLKAAEKGKFRRQVQHLRSKRSKIIIITQSLLNRKKASLLTRT